MQYALLHTDNPGVQKGAGWKTVVKEIRESGADRLDYTQVESCRGPEPDAECSAQSHSLPPRAPAPQVLELLRANDRVMVTDSAERETYLNYLNHSCARICDPEVSAGSRPLPKRPCALGALLLLPTL